MQEIRKILTFLKEHKLVLTTAESCTVGRIIHLLGKFSGSGQCLDAGYVVYSTDAKKRLLGVKQSTIDKYGLTSEEVAREMIKGALKDSPANIAVATTGVAGPTSMDGIPPGTVCISWGFQLNRQLSIYSETQQFSGSRSQILTMTAKYTLGKITDYYLLNQ